MKKIPLMCLAILLLSGCATTNSPLRDIHYIADGWIVAARQDGILVHAKEVEPVVEFTYHKATSPSGLTYIRYDKVPLKQYRVRLVNSGKEDMCVKIDWLVMDYSLDLSKGWFSVESWSTTYLGYVKQQAWRFSEKAYAFEDAKWAVNRIHSVPLIDGKCIFSGESVEE